MRPSYYKDSIIFFGIVIPGLIALLLCGGAWYAKSTVGDSLLRKSQVLASQKQTQTEIAQLEKTIAPQREFAQSWDNLVGIDLPTALNEELLDISQRIPAREFTLVSTNRVNSKTGLASVAKTNNTQAQFAFRGTYRGIQKGFLVLETRFPQLQVNDLKIDVNRQNNNLNVQASYGAWTK